MMRKRLAWGCESAVERLFPPTYTSWGYPRNYPLLIPANNPQITTFKKQAERLKRKAEPKLRSVFANWDMREWNAPVRSRGFLNW